MQTNPARIDSQKITRLLGGQRRRIRRRFLLHGLGWILGTLTALAVLYYLADRTLRLPGGIRLLLSAGILAYFVYALRRHVLYPMGRQFSRTDVAVVLERHFPELRQKLVSAFQLRELLEDANKDSLRNQSPEMIRLVVEAAAAESNKLPVQRILASRRTFLVWGLTSCAFLVAFTGATVNPEACGVFFQRILGFSTPYPRNTELQVRLPPESSELRKEVLRDEGIANLTMARGADLIVNVYARRGSPREVLLHTTGGRGGDREVAMSPRGGEQFRFVFRRVNESFEFHASGGDDDTGDLTVRVTTISPPQVANIRATLHQPAYTGNPVVIQTGGRIETLEGTAVELSVTATADVERATLSFLESGESIDLQAERIEDDSGVAITFHGAFQITASDRYMIELVGTTGLRNPRPGSYTINALRDFAPLGQLLNPDDDILEVVLPKAALPLRVFARDDFGITGVAVRVELTRAPGERILDLMPAGDPLGKEVVLSQVIDVLQLPADGALITIGETIGLTVEMTDNREPERQVTPLPRRQLPVVDEADLVRRIAGHFRRVRVDVIDAREKQQSGIDRLEGLIEELEAGEAPEQLQFILTGVDVGQARIQGTSESILEEFMRSFNLHLFNRQEPSIHAERVLEMYQSWHQANPDPRIFVTEFYRMLDTERRESRLGSMEAKLDPILSMIMRADRLATELSTEAIRLIKTAQIAGSEDETAVALVAVVDVQQEMFQELDQLRELLDKWNEFQDVIAETRALKDKQQDVEVRTRTIR